MRKLCLLLLCSLVPILLLAQSVAVNADGSAPNASAMLDVKSTTRGLLVPRMTALQRTQISSPANSLLVYQTDGLAGFYYYQETPEPHWLLLAAANSAWSLTGNAGTTTTNFIGTTDAQPLLFKVNNLSAGQIQVANNNTSFGIGTLVNSQVNGGLGNHNAAFGHSALYSNTTGYYNTAMGTGALYTNTTGRFNTAHGSFALYYNTTGESNTALGQSTLYSNTTGNYNTAIGDAALLWNTEGTGNTAIGYGSMRNNTTGIENTATGEGTLFKNETGRDNTATGDNALYFNTTGSYNTALGAAALTQGQEGSFNTAVGVSALHNNKVSGNTAVGYSALFSNQTGVDNTALGNSALIGNIGGSSNTAIGSEALRTNNSGYLNTAVGNWALFANSTGFSNTATGVSALLDNTTGSANTATGLEALQHNTSGSQNSAHGFGALGGNLTGRENTAVGFSALSSTTASYGNTAVGWTAGSWYNNGYYNTFIGSETRATAADIYNSTALGRGALVTAPSQVRIGNSFVGSIGGYANWSNISDGRYKKNVSEDVKGLDFILKLRPVTYNLNMSALSEKLKENNGKALSAPDQKALREKEQFRHSGFVAQEVEQAAKALGYEFSGIDAPKNGNDLYSLRYADFVVPLVKAVQEQQAVIYKQADELKALKEQVEKLTKAVQILSANR